MADRLTSSEVIGEILDATRTRIRTAFPARVVDYDRLTQTAEIEPLVRPNGEAEPLMQARAVIWPGGGDGALFFPLSAGDTGLVIICDVEIGAWRQRGGPGRPADEGRHELGHAVFIPGLRAANDLLPSGALSATALIGSNVKLGDVLADKAVVHEELPNALSHTFGTHFTTWIGEVVGVLTGLGGAAPPSTAGLLADLAAFVATNTANGFQSPSVDVED